MEDTSTVGPVAVKTDGLKEAVTLLEEEVIIDKLLTLGLCQIVQGIISAVKVTLHVGKSFTDLFLDFLSLVVCDTRAKGVVSKVSTDTDPGADDELSVFLREGWGIQFGGLHLDLFDMLLHTMVRFNDFIHKVLEGIVRVMAARVDTDT